MGEQWMNEKQQANLEKRYGGIPKVTEMDKLIALLADNPEGTKVISVYGRPSVRFLDKTGYEVGDVVCHWGSYGHQKGLLEAYGAVSNKDCDVEGWRTAEQVFSKWQEVKKELGWV